MSCARCGQDNPVSARFCNGCGAPLHPSCPACGHQNPASSRFCNACGRRLGEEPAPARATPEPAGGPAAPGAQRRAEAERRQVTVVFCDLVGSTPLSQALDPEDLRHVVREYQELASTAVREVDGHLAQYLGDGVLVYFGYPVGHEDDAERAVRAALRILERLPGLNADLGARFARLRERPLRARVGIHTGLVVAGTMGGQTRLEHLAIVGETPNIAARLQGLAEPDAILISEDTYRLTRGVFECEALGARELRGVARPVHVYRVTGEQAPWSRPEGVDTGESAIVGRDHELGLLLERWEEARGGLGQVVVVSGEAGIGKSRLLRGLKQRAALPPQWVLQGRCLPHHQQSPFFAFIDMLQRALRWARTDSEADKVARLEAALAPYPVPPEVVPALAGLLNLRLPVPEAAPATTPEGLRKQIVDAILQAILAIAAQHPLLVAIEDAHWMDPSSLEMVRLIAEQAPTARLLLALTARPSFEAPWGAQSHVTRLGLGRFGRRHTEALITSVAAGKRLPYEVLQEIVSKTDGVPLFTEELTKLVLESGLVRDRGDRYELIGPLPPLAIPSTLQESLTARLDRLAPVKEVAQLGATIGRSFPYEVIRAVSDLDEAALQAALDQLVVSEMLYQSRAGAAVSYVFKHALIQEAAYQALLRSSRQQYHQRIAQVLLERFPETAQTQPELLGYHFTGAGLPGPAIDHWRRAGELAAARSAHAEAVAHLGKALDLLQGEPEGTGRDRRELDLLVALGPSLGASRGLGAPAVEQTYARARELCERLDVATHLFPILTGLRRFYLVRADLARARTTAEAMIEVARRASDASEPVEAHYSLGVTLFWLGEPKTALEQLETAVAHCRRPASGLAADAVVHPFTYEAWVLWTLGYPEQALRRSEEAVRLARAGPPLMLSVALDFALALHEFRGEDDLAQELGEAAVALAEERGFPFWLGLARVRLGWAQVMRGRGPEGLARMRDGLALWESTGAVLARPFLLGLLAGALGRTGRVDEALSLLDRAQASFEQSQEGFFRAEIYRLRGELALRQPGPALETAETAFRGALQIARAQGARAFELRAALSLSRLWERAGRQDEARAVLAPIYEWFTEGWETADLREARARLGPPG